jgi:hypothetical protein
VSTAATWLGERRKLAMENVGPSYAIPRLFSR